MVGGLSSWAQVLQGGVPHRVLPAPQRGVASVIQDTVRDKQLTQEVPDVSVGPVLGGQSGVTKSPSSSLTPCHLVRGPLGLFCFLAPEEGYLILWGSSLSAGHAT